MLVLDRKISEGFWIGGGIFVKVLGVRRQRVKLGIDAPRDVRIVREELGSKSDADGVDPKAPVEPQTTEGPFRSVSRR